MDIELSDERQSLQRITRAFLEHIDPVTVVLKQGEYGAKFERDYWHQVVELGWTSMLIPEEYGGSATEESVLDLMIVAEEVGRLVSPGPLLPCNVVADALTRSGSRDQHTSLLPALAEGGIIATWAIAEEPDVWSANGVALRATRTSDEYMLEGTKSSVEAVDVADIFLVTAKADNGFVQLIVPRDTKGLTISTTPTLDLTRRFGTLVFDSIRIPASSAIGTPATVERDIERQMNLALTLQCAETVGMLEQVFQSTLDFIKDRFAFGRPIASYQAIKHRLADHKLWLEAALGVSTALGKALATDGVGVTEIASVAKSHIGDQSMSILSDCAQMIGGISMTWEHGFHLYLRRATVNRVLYGSPAQHRERLCTLVGV